MSSEEIIERFEATTALLERMAKWVVAMVVLVATGVLWGARLEWQGTRAIERLGEHETVIRVHDTRLHDIDVTLARRP